MTGPREGVPQPEPAEIKGFEGEGEESSKKKQREIRPAAF